mmetsp:Transcript_29688/g.47796  ORF Transcript_29688/g.47796 Transcript_29688/m.47796 type:complete len:185 (+) Transcript_29688:1-555(+)|eukprot:CAMPEP_0179446760 /NCGR_PEP_ID=MMETSP0799-20121207/30291_1 /TAXON_ID=46947 /ORGANISM="Geminigera cryophila, Strain CCMP2564" /LENGTH=184 /DNA_ID=CAMNT_0021236295 /DNA_START=1 /DNA_END=555 /DNA_ORIENTATION=+
MRFTSALYCVLGLACVQQGSSLLEFDSSKCSTEAPCCINAEDAAAYLGSMMGAKTFCHIDYPVKSEDVWKKRYARERDLEAKKDWEDNYKKNGCSKEECTGYVCAKWFPRCFYVNATHQGGFEFEVCRETCEECKATCKPSEKASCAGNPSQFEVACTSQACRADLSKMVLAFVTMSCLWFATV